MTLKIPTLDGAIDALASFARSRKTKTKARKTSPAHPTDVTDGRPAQQTAANTNNTNNTNPDWSPPEKRVTRETLRRDAIIERQDEQNILYARMQERWRNQMAANRAKFPGLDKLLNLLASEEQQTTFININELDLDLMYCVEASGVHLIDEKNVRFMAWSELVSFYDRIAKRCKCDRYGETVPVGLGGPGCPSLDPVREAMKVD